MQERRLPPLPKQRYQRETEDQLLNIMRIAKQQPVAKTLALKRNKSNQSSTSD
jgi:hypothetical protein